MVHLSRIVAVAQHKYILDNACMVYEAVSYTHLRYGDKTEVLFAQHHWPRWGKERISQFLAKERNGYKYMQDVYKRQAL